MNRNFVLTFLFCSVVACLTACGPATTVSDDSGADSGYDAIDSGRDTGDDLYTDNGNFPDAADSGDASDVPATSDIQADSSDSRDAADEGTQSFRVFDMSDQGNINAMWGSAQMSIWAVGAAGLVLKLRGDEFVNGPIPPVKVDFFGIDGFDDTLYVVGAGGTALRYRNGSWADLECPVDRDLFAVSCPGRDECYAVGRAGTIVHYLDGVWTEQDSGVGYDIFGVLSEVNGGTWAVGAFGSLFELSGTSWISSQVAGSRSFMKSIYRAPDGTMFAVGTLGTIVRKRPGADRWEQQLSNDPSEPPRDLYSVTGASAEDVWAVGDFGAVLHWDGLHWEVADVAGPINIYADLRTVSLLSSVDGYTAFAAGLRSSLLQAKRTAGTDSGDGAWFDRHPGIESDLTGVWLEKSGDSDSDSDSVLFCGDNGLIIERRGGLFGLVETGDFSSLTALDAGMAVGAGGSMWLIGEPGADGTRSVSRRVSSTVEDLVAIDADDSGWVFAGAEGSVFSMSFEDPVPTFVGQVAGTLTSVCRTPLGIFAAGENGVLGFAPASARDQSFSDVMTFTRSAIRDLTPTPDGGVLAVGDNGIVLSCGTSVCEKLYSDPVSFIYGVCGVASESDTPEFFAAGWAGTLLKCSEGTVEKVPTGTARVFLDIDGSGNGLYLAGRKGVAAYFRPDGGVLP